MSTTDKTEPNSEDLIVVGSSAGGVEALSVLVSTLPDNFPAPIVLAQHLDPNHSSSLDAILQRRTRLLVEVITSSNHLQAGRIYVVPANRHVSIKDHRVEVHEDRSKRPRPSINALLSTAAESYGDRLIAVILTGSGSDGAIGAVDVKNAGGIVIVQDPQTARYPSMPLALPPTIVDFEHVDYGYRVSKTLRQMVIFGQQDLSRSAPFPRIDLVLCRNVLIYFTSDLQDYVLNQFAFSLSPDGYLFLGKAETVRPAQSFYELVNKHWKMYHCTGNPLPSIRQLVQSNTSRSPLERSVVHHPRNTGKQHVAQDIPLLLSLGSCAALMNCYCVTCLLG